MIVGTAAYSTVLISVVYMKKVLCQNDMACLDIGGYFRAWCVVALD